jgi:hypothetical protein
MKAEDSPMSGLHKEFLFFMKTRTAAVLLGVAVLGIVIFKPFSFLVHCLFDMNSHESIAQAWSAVILLVATGGISGLVVRRSCIRITRKAARLGLTYTAGVLCGTALTFPSVVYMGTISPFVSNIFLAIVFGLAGNNLSGSIPDAMGESLMIPFYAISHMASCRGFPWRGRSESGNSFTKGLVPLEVISQEPRFFAQQARLSLDQKSRNSFQ